MRRNKMNFLNNLFGPKDPEVETKQLINKLHYVSSSVNSIESEIDRLISRNPLLDAVFIGGFGNTRTNEAREHVQNLKRKLAEAKEKEMKVRVKTATRLGELGCKSAVEPLITAINDKYPQVRSSAAIALGQIGDDRAIEPLANLSKTEKIESVKDKILQALEIIQK
jgi:hypothetical protein